MSVQRKSYCRLCAELRPTTAMLSPNKDVVANSKVIIKLSWINIDLCSNNGLPNTLCYPCLDELDRTWRFLNSVRSSQEKLIGLFLSASKEDTYDAELDNEEYVTKTPGKPVDENWEIFQELKREIKIEYLNENIPTLQNSGSTVISDGNELRIKLETVNDKKTDVILDSNDDIDQLSSTDSDIPLKMSLQKKTKHSKRKKCKIDSKINLTNTTWDNQACVCAKCDAQCQNILLLQLHSLQMHGCCSIFKCVECSKVSPGYRSFIRHTRTHNKALRHCCEFCNRTFIYSPDLSSHKMRDHKSVYKTKCVNCGASFDTEQQLEEHKKLFSKNMKIKKAPCDDQLEYKCNECGKVFKSQANLHQHKQLHTERTKDFACHICGKMFYTKGTLGTHLVVHEEKRPHKCNHCPLAFRAKGNLISHLSLHSGLKPFICEQCGKSFRVKRHLISHSIVHTDLRPYVCEYCNKSFRFKTRLNLHLRQHTGVRPYKCIYCQRDFTNGSNYKKHMKRRHGIDTSTRLTLSKIVNKKEQNAICETVSQ